MKIFKYPLEVTDNQVISIPGLIEVLTVQVQRGVPCLWALVSELEEESYAQEVAIIGTGNPINYALGQYLSTFQLADGALVFHVFLGV